jgi:epoxyqueuosine reductase QueG
VSRRAVRPPVHREEFRDWLREGAAGEMQWLERGAEKRANPQLVLRGAQSVIVWD